MYSEFQFYSCPKCGDFVIKDQHGVSFYHTSVDFTDGKNRSQFYFSDMKITKCHGCENVYWLRDDNHVGDYNPRLGPLSIADEEMIRKIPNWEKVKSAALPSVPGLDELLKTGDYRGVDEELYLRQNMHWALNDRYIFEERIFHDDAEKTIWEENIKSLISLVGNKWGYRLFLAELYRNLGRFFLAKWVLAWTLSISPASRKLKKAIYRACKNKDRMVVPVSANRMEEWVFERFPETVCQ